MNHVRKIALTSMLAVVALIAVLAFRSTEVAAQVAPTTGPKEKAIFVEAMDAGATSLNTFLAANTAYTIKSINPVQASSGHHAHKAGWLVILSR